MLGYAVGKNRNEKAQKIEAVLQDFLGKKITQLEILDIGTGSGEIAYYIASNDNNVYAVDLEDQTDPKCKNMFTFIKINDERLPFEDCRFDIVITNHVIEHVSDQHKHLSEIARVMKKDGVCYFATPNRFFIKEPHLKTWLLHYLPKRAYFQTLRILGKYKEPIHLLSYIKMKKIFIQYQLKYYEYTSDIINHPVKYHYKKLLIPIKIPKFVQIISPTNIFVLTKP